MNRERQLIYLGSLLHDIGKLVFRSQEHKAGEGHELLGEQFIREYIGKIEILKPYIEKIIYESKHHKTATYCRIADRIASQERTKDESKLTRRPLLSIMNSLSLEDEYQEPKGIYYYKPSVNSITDILPIHDKEYDMIDKWKYDEALSVQEHKEILKALIRELEELKHLKAINVVSDTLFFLLKKYMSRICSAGYKSVPDISLFDHGRAIGGLVNCLTYQLTEEDLPKFLASPPASEFLFIKGDIGGIQKFIYSNISLNKVGGSRDISKKLRGRSLYVSLLTDLIANLFLEKIELTEANILYSGGGHFNIVCPYNKNVENIIDNLTKEINLFLLEKIGTSLNLVVGKTICDNSLYNNANIFISKVNFSLNNEKLKVHEKYLNEVLNKELQIEKRDFTDDYLIGKVIPYAKYIIELTSKDVADFNGDKSLIASFVKFNKYYFVIKAGRGTTEYELIYKFFKDNINKITSAKLIKLNDNNFLEFARKLSSEISIPVSFEYRYYGKYAPTDQYGDIIEFSEIAKLNSVENHCNEELNYPKLAVMRLDVDNLGSLFEFGLGKKVSFSRIATLSRELDSFFSGYFNVLAEKYKVYITYSGGDDAFVVGSWINILHFARELYELFRKFTCFNNDITFSAGIFMCDEHYPVGKFSKRAAEAEEKAKSYLNAEGKSKNAITVFDHTLNWENYCTMIDFAQKLTRYTKESDHIKDNEKLNRSLIHRILRIIKASLKRNGEVDVSKLYRNLAGLHYLFARHGFKAEEIESATEGIAKDIISVFLKVFSKEEIIKDYLIPTHYVVLKTRKIN